MVIKRNNFMPNKIQEAIEKGKQEIDQKFWSNAGKGLRIQFGDASRIVTNYDIKSFLSSYTQTLLQAVAEEAKKLECDERKIKEFGYWVAASYSEKQLVNAVLSEFKNILEEAMKEIK